ncbi:MAG: MFS transporter [Ignavibacteriales bacterium]|nr:MAG: MFS transporter [Ignavibacteriales bacterium]
MVKSSERFRIFIWTLFDFANTSYSITIVTFLYAVYFKKVVANNEPAGDLYWSIATSSAMIVTAILSPILGAISDHSAGKKRFLLFFTIICVVFTAALFGVEQGDIFLGILFFVLANIGFEAGLVFYDSFLPEITTPKNYGRVSGYGFAMGYVGSLTTLIILFPFIEKNLIRESFLISAMFFAIFATPLFIFLQDNRRPMLKPQSYIKTGWNRVSYTISHLKNYKNLSRFLLAYFFYIEGVNTIIFFAGNYASTTLKFTELELIAFFATVQTTAIIGSVLLGIAADSLGQKKTIYISLYVWLVTIALALFTETKEGFYVVGLLAGTAMGASQSTSRSLMSKLTPVDKRTEFFGFYSLFGKSSAIIGPLVFGIISVITHNQKLSILSVGVFFIIGMYLLKDVKDNIPAEQSEQVTG